MYVSTLGLRSDQQTRECAAKFDVKAAFASLSAFSFPEMPTCEGTHAMTSWVCGGIFLRRLLNYKRPEEIYKKTTLTGCLVTDIFE